MKPPYELKDRSKYCLFDHDYDHDTKECHELRNQIEELICRGYLKCYIKKLWLSPPCPHGLVAK